MIATFANGQSVEADFLIGADGIHSRVRAQFINDGDPIDRGYTIWRGISPTIPAAIPPATAIEIHGRGKRFGIGPVGLGRLAGGRQQTQPTLMNCQRSVCRLVSTRARINRSDANFIDSENRRLRSRARSEAGATGE